MILDGLDSLLSPEHEVSQLSRSRAWKADGQLTPSTQVTILAEVFCRLANPDNLDGIMVIATASSTSSLHPLISTKHVFGETIKIAPLTKERRRDVSPIIVVSLRLDIGQIGRRCRYRA
jgi:peroxin-1